MRPRNLQNQLISAAADLARVGVNILQHEPLSWHTSFGIGGPADIFVSPKTIEEFITILNYSWLTGLPTKVIGYGSNLLVRDHGFRGLVIYTGCIQRYRIYAAGLIEADTGASLRSLSMAAAENGLSGLEFAAGIPGTVGGAVIMNASSGGDAMCSATARVQVIGPSLKRVWLDNSECRCGYSTSRFRTSSDSILRVILRLQPGYSPSQILRETYRRLAAKSATQPLVAHCAGSTFLNPDGVSAGRLIEEAGLKGSTRGGAVVSFRHAGFIINRCNASANDVLKLIDHVRVIVLRHLGFTLDLEIEDMGE